MGDIIIVLRMYMIQAIASILVMLLAIPDATGEKNHYQDCMAKAKSFPKDAFEDAIQWRDFGGGDAAEHCAAYALISLGLSKEAATRLENLAVKTQLSTANRAQIFGQAAQAWLLANIPQKAKALATTGLKLYPENIELLIDRAQAHAALKDYTSAKTDLDAVLTKRPGHVEALTFRASTKRYIGDNLGAFSDIERALSIDKSYVPALLERGNLRRLKGNKKGARADWLLVLSYQTKGIAAKSARRNLERMDIITDK